MPHHLSLLFCRPPRNLPERVDDMGWAIIGMKSFSVLRVIGHLAVADLFRPRLFQPPYSMRLAYSPCLPTVSLC